MTLLTTKHIMTIDEFERIVHKLKGNRKGWIERVSEVSAIDKPTLSKYASGKRKISKTHALFLRQTYFLQCGFPDLPNDLNVMIRSDVSTEESFPCFDDIKAKASMTAEIRGMVSAMNKIKEITNEY